MSGFNWVCPYCDRPQTATDPKYASIQEPFYVSQPGVVGPIGIRATVIVCSNPDCEQPTVQVGVVPYVRNQSGGLNLRKDAEPLLWKRLLPEVGGRPLPDFIPPAIRQDYAEACLIKDQSPKASATLARRCLQGMIRDFGKVKPDTLNNEIKALQKAATDGNAPRGVSEDSIDALTAVRKVGNIGAHMDADINVIVDVDPNEAQVLLELIESLLDDWYVESHKRQQRFAKAVALGQEKAAQLKDAKAGQSALPAPHSDDG